jgi:hypothetical protein
MTMPRPSIAERLAGNSETHVECVPRPRHWGGFSTTKPAELLPFYPGADTTVSRDIKATLYAPHVCQHCGSYKPRDIEFAEAGELSATIAHLV